MPAGADPANPELTVVVESDLDILAGFSAAQELIDDGDDEAADGPPYLLEMEVDPSGTGFVDASPAGPEFDEGDFVMVTATPAEGYEFVGWSGDVSSSEASMTFSMGGDTHLVAQFAEPSGAEYQLTAYVESGEGSIVRDPADFTYDEGAEVVLTAFADEGFVFSGWSGDVPEGADLANPELTVVVDSDLELLATFATAATLDNESAIGDASACGAVGLVSLSAMFLLMVMMKFARLGRG